MSDDLPIDFHSLAKELLSIPQEMRKVLTRCNKLDEKLQEAKVSLEAFDFTLSNDISLNPEKYGFPLGSQPERFKVLARINSHPEHKKKSESIIYYRIRLSNANVEKVSLQMKFEALKCLLSSLPNIP